MEKITVDEENKKKILKYIRSRVSVYGYEKDISILEGTGQLTEKLARYVFEDIMSKCQITRDVLIPNGEIEQEIAQVFDKFDKIPKPKDYEQYGYYDGAFDSMQLNEVYENMQICFNFTEIEQKYDAINDSRRIADSVISSINSIDRLEIQVEQETKTELERIRENLQHSLSNEKTDVNFIQEQVERYNVDAIEIWNEYLTETEVGKENDFKYLIHNLAKGEIKGDFRTKYMSTSLITNRTMGVFGGKSKYGLILKPKHIVSADYKDTYTNNYRENDEQLFNIKPPIKLPQEIEEICIEQTIEANGEMLNYDEASIYSEIVVDEYEIAGMYFISNGEGELSPNYDRAKRMAEERKIALKELDISQCRVDNGLEAMTENTQIEFCRNILYRCCAGDKELQEAYQKYSSSFTDKYAKEFYEKYMLLKKQGDFSKGDILKKFSEITRDDIHFQKISQNVEEMYLSDEEKQNLRLQREYGIANIFDKEGLQQRLEKVVSERPIEKSIRDEVKNKQESEKMKSKKEIEEKIGFELEYREYETYINGNDYNNFHDEVVKHRTLEPKSVDAVKKLLIESLENGDIETSNVCESILREAEISDSELDSDFKGKREKLQFQFIDKYIPELQSIDIESLDRSKVEEILENYQIVSNFGDKQNLSDEKQQLAEVIQSKVESRIQVLDSQITESREHIEIPENEQKINKLQQETEDIEEIYVDFKAKMEYSKEMKNLEGKQITAFSHPKGIEEIKKELQENIFNHKAKRIEEQGIDTPEIMQNISQYRAVDLRGRNSSDYYMREYEELNEKVSKKTEYLEKKLAFLQENKEIPGNAERISQIETELETMQDSWIVAQQGYNNIDGIIETATSRMNDIQRRIEQTKKELETIDSMSTVYMQKRDEIENLTNESQKYEKYIVKIQQTGQEIENGTNKSFMGKHHKDRLAREEKEKIENDRGKIQELDSQIAVLEQHIEIPENEQKIIDLQAQIDKIESTIPSDRGTHKRERLQQQGRDTETIMKGIEDIISEFNSPYVRYSAESIDAEIKTRVGFLENKMQQLQEHLDIPGNKERIEKIQNQIENLEDKWELCAQGFGSKEQVEQRIRITKGHLYTDLMSFKGNKELNLNPEQMQEYWERLQKGEEIPELMGEHHRNRLIREKQEELSKIEQEYGISGMQDRNSLQTRLEHTISDGIQYGASKSEYGDKKLQEIKQVLPQFDEFKKVYLQLREDGIEDKLYENIDFENVTYAELLQRATTIVEEKNRNDEIEQARIRAEQEEKVKAEEQARIKAEQEARVKAEEQAKIKVEQEAKAQNETTQEEQQYTSDSVEEYWKEVNEQNAKIFERPQIERIKPREESIKDEIGDKKDIENKIQIKESQSPSVDLWMNRFSNWYSSIDRVSQNVKAKFVNMKSDIVNAISNTLKERTNKREQNIQKQDSNER